MLSYEASSLINGLFNGERAYRDLEKLSLEIGPRPAGSKAEAEAAKCIASEFESLDLKTTIQEFEITTGKILSKRLEIIEPYREEVACQATALMGDTGPEGVEGELVYLETTDEEYLTPEITGKIVVTLKFKTKNLKLISKYRPLGFILIEAYPGVPPKHLWGNKERWEKYGNFPTVRVSHEDGLKLLCSRAKQACLVVESEAWKVKSKNVIGELVGSLRPEEIVIVGGHYDTVPEVRGASDNAGGTAIVLELARVFKEKGTKRTLRFIAWGNEEMGLVGSHHYAQELKKTSEELKNKGSDEESELDRIKLVVNLDVHGALLGTNEAAVLGPMDLTASVKLLSKELGTVFDIKETVYSSDGTSLSSIGIPNVTFGRSSGSDILMHTVEDTVRWISPTVLKVQGEFVEQFLTRYVTEAAAFPFEKEIPEKQKKEIEKYYRERLRTPP
jgi:aminopeptidase YwaD